MGTLDGPAPGALDEPDDAKYRSVETISISNRFGTGETQERVPLVPNQSQSGKDNDDTTPLSFDLSIGDYSEYIVSVDVVTYGDGVKDTLDIRINNITNSSYKQVEFDSNDGGISENTGSEWRVGFFSGDQRSYRTLFRIESNNSDNGNNLASFAPFTAVDTTQPTPFSGFYDPAASNPDVDAISSIQLSTSTNATAVVTVQGIKGISK